MNDNEIGKRIRQYRKGKMTQQELAAKINRTESSIRKYEKGLVTIPLDVLEEIAIALGVDTFDLMGFDEFDRKYSNTGKEFREYEGLIAHLKELGYSYTESPEKGNNEEGCTAASCTITGNGIQVTLSSEQFKRLQSSSADLIRSFLWGVQQEQKK